MSWASAIRKPAAQTKIAAAIKIVSRPQIETADVDWDRLVSLDFETLFDADYTLSKLSTSEYVRDERFEALMVGIKIGNKKTKVVPHNKIAAELAAINWETHSVLCHNVQFDGFILSHHYGVFPKRYYCTLGMARGLHSNEIGAGLHDVSLFYGGKGKIDGGVEGMKGMRFKELFANKPLWKRSAEYCANDVDEMFRIFCAMHPLFPAKEMDLIHMTARMFCAPVLKIDIPRVQTEYEREVTRREELLLNLLNPRDYDDVLDGKDKKLEGKERDMRIVKKVVGSNERFVALFEALGIARDQLPRKLSPAWMKKNQAEREEAIDSKWAFAFAKDDLDFINMPEQVWEYFPHLDPANPDDVLEAAGLSEKLQQLIDTRIAVKSTTNITRAERFLKAGANGMSLPVGYAYYRAHTGRWGGNNKMNMQNLTRGGELRLSILAAKGHQISVADSGQIEARVNAWLWDQFDLLDAFRDKRDVYSEFATDIYGRKITKEDKNDRHVGKVCLAEGELVLTHRGEVPINLVSLEDRLWDGVEWVSHDGLIDQGIQEVITYDGLTATPDHEVFTECGRIIPLWQAASEMARLQRTGAEGKNLRFCDDHVVADTPRKRLSVRQGPMRPDWYYQADVAQQLEAQQELDIPATTQRIDGRANSRQVRCYDIANAGPRFRYTVAGKLVLNCVLGLGYQMGAPKLQMTLAKGALGGPKIALSIDQCQHIVNTYRRKYYAIKQGWDRSKDFIEHMANPGLEPLQYKCLEIGFEYIRLPNGMCLKYPDLRMAKGEKGWDEWSYQSGDIRKKIYGGLLCLGASTEVLTDDGWKPIISVRHDDKLWDGTNWVSHSGLVHQGVKETVSFGGVDMTPDHEVLVNNRWYAAERTTHHEATSSFARHHRHPFRHAYGNQSSWVRWSQDALDSVLRLRPHEDFLSHRILKGAHKELWVLDDRAYRRVTNDAWHVQAPGLLSLAQYAGPLQTAHASILGALRWARDHGVRGVERLRHILGGHADWVRSWPGPGSTRQLPGIQSRELPMGDATGEHSKHPIAITDWHADRPYAPLASSRNIRDRENDAALPSHAQLASGQDVRQTKRQKQAVFDLADAGPLKRFTVRGDDGLPFIVHNCENLVQALARIIVAEQMLMIDTKYPVVMTTHDEAVTHPKTKDAAKCYAFMEKCMTTPLWWCPEIPLAAEGGFAENYSK